MHAAREEDLSTFLPADVSLFDWLRHVTRVLPSAKALKSDKYAAAFQKKEGLFAQKNNISRQ